MAYMYGHFKFERIDGGTDIRITDMFGNKVYQVSMEVVPAIDSLRRCGKVSGQPSEHLTNQIKYHERKQLSEAVCWWQRSFA